MTTQPHDPAAVLCDDCLCPIAPDDTTAECDGCQGTCHAHCLQESRHPHSVKHLCRRCCQEDGPVCSECGVAMSDDDDELRVCHRCGVWLCMDCTVSTKRNDYCPQHAPNKRPDVVPSHDPAAVDSPDMADWLADFDSATEYLQRVSAAHIAGDHTLCENAVPWLMLACEDIGLTEAEAWVMLGCFADVMAASDATVMAKSWAGYFDREGVA